MNFNEDVWNMIFKPKWPSDDNTIERKPIGKVDSGVHMKLELDPSKNFVYDYGIPKFENKIKKIIFNGNRTIVLWTDGTKTVVACKEDEQFDEYAGFSAAVMKKIFGSTSHVKKVLNAKAVRQDKGGNSNDKS